MTMAIKKRELIKRLSKVEDQEIIDKIDAILPNTELNNKELVEKYKSRSNRKFSLEKLIKQQGKKPFDVEKIDRLSKEANIQEPIEELLKMLD